ncbi:3-dehydroquinate synthase [Hyphomonas adhaerens MHS-3]|uniref:3-dehydroquinate synthase n=1 Tax=Hyphomonas adhaerens MHS-3 TaxID=1280949 RepID=A0A069E4I0_9PROT|nr:3-dehydroquinate synthase [Hyphomonas adhaerens]KCZ84937.1 3-dehydroquinate synthase [Hyphomonas adhaerens MHS-3]
MSVTAPELETVSVDLGARSYDILVGHGALDQLGPRLAAMLKQSRVFVLTDANVEAAHRARVEAALSASGISSSWLALTPGEKTKSFSNLEAILDWLLEGGADRSDILVALGGGVIGDIAGLSASLMKRGMGFVQVPTTLLAQVDSSVGGKTAVNSPRGKNLIGAFYQPRLVIADTGLLETLPARELRAGYAEIVKYGLINDPAFFDWLEANGARVLALDAEAITYAVAVSCRAKAAIVAEDETEKGVRALLNLGHTFGHALEAANDYRPDLLHGEAVSIGMALAFRYGAATGITPPEDADRVTRVLEASGLQAAIPGRQGGAYTASELVRLMQQDKKASGGKVPLILARGIGQAYIHPDADLAAVEDFLRGETSEG